MKIIGYLKKFGKLSFAEFPFGEVDSVIFAILSYLKWEKFGPKLESHEKLVLPDFCSKKYRMIGKGEEQSMVLAFLLVV